MIGEYDPHSPVFLIFDLFSLGFKTEKTIFVFEEETNIVSRRYMYM